MEDDDLEMDLEVAAMPKLYGLLKSLTDEERARLITWVVDKLNISANLPTQSGGQLPQPMQVEQADYPLDGPVAEAVLRTQPVTADEFATFAELCAAADPASDADKALVAGYWFQVCQGQESFSSMACNQELKHYGTAVGNITRAFDRLKARRPQLVVQLEKSGRSMQSRKKYKVTTAGTKAVEEMVRNNVHA